MSDKPEPQEELPETVQPTEELSDEELDDVAGGKPSFNDFNFTHKVDKSSPS
jgi:type VI protein secretion system component Hcp